MSWPESARYGEPPALPQGPSRRWGWTQLEAVWPAQSHWPAVAWGTSPQLRLLSWCPLQGLPGARPVNEGSLFIRQALSVSPPGPHPCTMAQTWPLR